MAKNTCYSYAVVCLNLALGNPDYWGRGGGGRGFITPSRDCKKKAGLPAGSPIDSRRILCPGAIT